MHIIQNLISNFQNYLLILPVALISLTVHECAHGFVAYKLGDPTAKNEGRLTLNPLKHIDPIGLLMMMFLRVGWAKPVPVSPLYFKSPKKGMLLTALAGPVSNIALAFVSVPLCEIFGYIAYINAGALSTVFGIAAEIFFLFAILNLGYAVFNLIPVHPLDGSRVLGYFMPDSFNMFFVRYGQYFQIAFFVLILATDVISNAVYFVQINLYSLIAFVWRFPLNAIFNLF